MPTWPSQSSPSAGSLLDGVSSSRIVAGRDRITSSVEIFRDGALQILRLESFSRKSAVGGVVISEGAAHAIVTTSAGQQGVDFLGGSLGITLSDRR